MYNYIGSDLQTRSRDQDAKEYYRAMRQQRTIVDDLRTKEGLIDEHKKKISELQVQLKDFATAYEVGIWT